MTRDWGPPTWFLFHTIAQQIDSNFYKHQSAYILTLIKNICSVLPCPICQYHATKYMRKIHPNQVRTKEQLQNILFEFHNRVNARLDKPQFKKEELTKYHRANLPIIVRYFENQMMRNYSLNRGFAEQMYRRRLAQEIVQFIKSNQTYFYHV